MKQKTEWRPDTCGCRILLGWDDATALPVHEILGVIPCAVHAGLGDKQAVFKAVVEENQRKNQVVNELADKPVTWSFGDGSPRVLKVSAPDHPIGVLRSKLEWVNKTFGVGQVELS